MRRILTLLIIAAFIFAAQAKEGIQLSSKLTAVLKDKCMSCHNAKKKKGKFDIEALIKSPNSAEDWLNIHDVVMAGDMPPEDEPQLSAAQKIDLINNLPSVKSKELARLLTPTEINNTLMDFFKTKGDTFNAESLLKVNYDDESFMTEQTEMISPYYIDDLYQTLDTSIKTLVHARKLPKPVTVEGLLTARGHVSKTVNIIENVNGKKTKSKGGDLRWRWKGGASFGFNYPESEANILPPGIYEMSFDIQTPNYGKPFKDKSMAAPYGFLKDGGKFEVAFSMSAKSSIGASNLFKVIEVPVEKTRMTIKLDISFPSKISAQLVKGPSGGKFKYNIDKFYGKGAWKSDKYPLPCVRFTNVEIKGPIGLAKADTTIYGDRLNPSEVAKKLAQVQKNNYLPVDSDHMKSFEYFREQGLSFEEAYRKSILMFFMSSNFLNLKFSDNFAEQARFSSYALMKSSPNRDFGMQFKKFQQTKNGKALAAWMIKHPQFDRFLKPFTNQWLKMDHLKNSPPGKANFPVFYSQRLGQLFPSETMAFMNYMFRANRPIHELVTANYSFLNPTLHSFYKTGEESKQLNRKGVYENFGEYEKCSASAEIGQLVIFC